MSALSTLKLSPDKASLHEPCTAQDVREVLWQLTLTIGGKHAPQIDLVSRMGPTISGIEHYAASVGIFVSLDQAALSLQPVWGRHPLACTRPLRPSKMRQRCIGRPGGRPTQYAQVFGPRVSLSGYAVAERRGGEYIPADCGVLCPGEADIAGAKLYRFIVLGMDTGA